jgi:hypothetical protein
MAIISLIFDYDIHYKWQLFLMTIMDCTMLTRKLLGLPAHKHLLHRLSKTSPLHLRHLKFARFLFEFHAHRFESLDLPFLPADRSDFDVHGALLDDKVHEYVIL